MLQGAHGEEILLPQTVVGRHVVRIFEDRPVGGEALLLADDLHRLLVNHLDRLVDDPLVVREVRVPDVARLDEDATPRSEDAAPRSHCLVEIEVQVNGVGGDDPVDPTLEQGIAQDLVDSLEPALVTQVPDPTEGHARLDPKLLQSQAQKLR